MKQMINGKALANSIVFFMLLFSMLFLSSSDGDIGKSFFHLLITIILWIFFYESMGKVFGGKA